MHKNFLILGANTMAAFMDFGVGCLVVALVMHTIDEPIFWPHIFIGGFLALIPDLDLLPSVLAGRSAQFNHRQTLFHRPLLVLPVAIMLAFLVGGIDWASITFLCVFWHYLHDTNFTDTSYGIAWLWPFSSQYWSVWGSYMSQSDMGHHQWLEQYWLKPTFLSAREIGIGSACLLFAVLISGVPFIFITALSAAVVCGVGYVWAFGSHIVVV